METVEVRRREVDKANMVGLVPKATEFSRLIRRDTTLTEDGRPIAVYQTLGRDLVEALRVVALKSRISKGTRTEGVPVASAIYGTLPRIALRQNFCRYTAESLRAQGFLSIVEGFSLVLSEVYRRTLPAEWERNRCLVAEQVEPAYLLRPEADTETPPFTTCNFNVNHAIRYHTDTGNFRDVFSNVLILRAGITGGALVCPEFDLAFAQDDRALILFDGQHILHGVTPIRRRHPRGYRCSVVFYALEAMKNCYPFAAELERARGWRTDVEGHFRPAVPSPTRGNVAARNVAAAAEREES